MKNKMKKKMSIFLLVLLLMAFIVACSGREEKGEDETADMETGTQTTETQNHAQSERFTLETKVKDVINDPAFGDYGRLIFPVDMNIDDDLTLQDAEDILPWDSEVTPISRMDMLQLFNKIIGALN